MTLMWVTEHLRCEDIISNNKIIMSNNKIMQFSYFYGDTNEKKADEKTTLFHDGICMTAILRDASGKMHRGILFDSRLDSTYAQSRGGKLPYITYTGMCRPKGS